MQGRFPKGHTPWNKDMKGIHLSPSTEFKKGERVMENHPSWKGGVQKVKNDCTYIAVAPNKRVRRPRRVYEEHNGPVPKGSIIYHLDGDKDNDHHTNLEAISRGELMKRNSRR